MRLSIGGHRRARNSATSQSFGVVVRVLRASIVKIEVEDALGMFVGSGEMSRGAESSAAGRGRGRWRACAAAGRGDAMQGWLW